jgi:hypothetical protein
MRCGSTLVYCTTCAVSTTRIRIPCPAPPLGRAQQHPFRQTPEATQHVSHPTHRATTHLSQVHRLQDPRLQIVEFGAQGSVFGAQGSVFGAQSFVFLPQFHAKGRRRSQVHTLRFPPLLCTPLVHPGIKRSRGHCGRHDPDKEGMRNKDDSSLTHASAAGRPRIAGQRRPGRNEVWRPW